MWSAYYNLSIALFTKHSFDIAGAFQKSQKCIILLLSF